MVMAALSQIFGRLQTKRAGVAARSVGCDEQTSSICRFASEKATFEKITKCFFSSFVGRLPPDRQGRGQVVKLREGRCFPQGVAAHEIIHALGFYHEQSRPDRDRHVKVDFNNIKSGNFILPRIYGSFKSFYDV